MSSERVTIGIPAYNEERNITVLLENLRRQAAGFDHEILVVSDGSSDGTNELVQKFAMSDPSTRLIVHSRRFGKAEVINTIIREACGNLIVLVSGDTQPSTGSVNNLLDVLRKDAGTGLVWAKPRPVSADEGLVAHIGRVCFNLHSKLMTRLEQLGELKHSTGELLVFRRGIVDRLPPDCVNDDEYLALATVRRKFKVRLASDTEVRFVLPSNIREYLRQRRKWVYGHMQMKRIAGEFPSVMEFSFGRNPRLVVKAIADQLIENPRDFFFLLTAMILEVVVLGWLLPQVMAPRSHLDWKIVESTKKFPTESFGRETSHTPAVKGTCA